MVFEDCHNLHLRLSLDISNTNRSLRPLLAKYGQPGISVLLSEAITPHGHLPQLQQPFIGNHHTNIWLIKLFNQYS